jgi:hypothetical protein
MLFVPPALDLDEQCGVWNREQLVQQNDRFVAAVEAAFQAGHESRAAARATVQIGRSGAVDVERAIEAAWQWFVSNRDETDIPFATIVAFVRARCSGVDPAQIRAGFERRFGRRSSPTSSAV